MPFESNDRPAFTVNVKKTHLFINSITKNRDLPAEIKIKLI